MGILLASLILAGSLTVGAAADYAGKITPVVDGKKIVQVYSHRGARSYAPENTMPGYITGLAIGTHWVDMDIVMDKNGDIVVSHDIWLNPDIVRGPNGKFIADNKATLIAGVEPSQLTTFLQPYLAKKLTFQQLSTYDVGRINPQSNYGKYFPDQLGMDGVHMPLLRDVIKYVNKVTKGNVGFQIEFKTDPAHPDWTYTPSEFAVALNKVLKEEGIEKNCEIQSFDWQCLYELQKINSNVVTAYLTSTDNEKGGADDFYSQDKNVAGLWTGGKLVADYNNSIPQMVKALGGKCWEPEDAELTLASLQEAHNLGLKVVVWTWTEKSGKAFDPQMVEKLLEWGVDGIITDDPGQLISMMAARGYKVPQRY